MEQNEKETWEAKQEKLVQQTKILIEIVKNSVGIVDRFGINIRNGLQSVGQGLTDLSKSIDKLSNSGVDVQIGRKNKFFGRK